MAHAINWFEIPASDFERAKKFYEAVLDIQMVLPFPGMKYAMFPADMQNGEIGGGLVEEQGYVPSGNGSLVYLNGGDDLSVPLARVEAAGGKIFMSKKSLGPNGFMAMFYDTEGNRVAFHSMK
ncbi:VOC family protein [Sediminibacterium roseum]|uniref:VOC family protein n=1 Tax=Sediminibacterium roseum TaxID=1978412 RepID=A0ABW9ZX75_9BACT|nr:VOC family protein [Sediminibacterium roseum]NCI50322.1 VOC family protein [Sediminibacterium roseum]